MPLRLTVAAALAATAVATPAARAQGPAPSAAPGTPRGLPPAPLDSAAPETLVVARYDALGGDLVGLPVAKGTSDAPAMAILVRVEPAAPHRIREIGLARIAGEP